MRHINQLGIWVGLGLLSGLVGCSGSVSTDNSDGSGASSGHAGNSAGGASASGGASGASSAGSAGHAAGSAGSGGACDEGAIMGAGCFICQCHNGGWGCTTSTACGTKQCGGFAGNTCSANEYCAYMPGQSCGASDASAVCMPRPDACTDIYMPVCGCDQKNYPSACDAAANGQGVYSVGVCPPAM